MDWKVLDQKELDWKGLNWIRKEVIILRAWIEKSTELDCVVTFGTHFMWCWAPGAVYLTCTWG